MPFVAFIAEFIRSSPVCAELQDLRAKYLNKCHQQNPNLLKLDQLMNLTSTVRLTHLSMYCEMITIRVHHKIFNLSFVHPRGNKKSRTDSPVDLSPCQDNSRIPRSTKEFPSFLKKIARFYHSWSSP